MFLQKLSLKNFRNYSELNLEFTSTTIILVGDNAQGKSNLLESIYFLATTKSSKANKDEELINQEQTSLSVTGHLDDQTSLEITMQNMPSSVGEITFGGLGSNFEGSRIAKRMKVNGVSRRVIDYIGHLSVVLFSPEDINLVTGSPSLRRWHIDLTLAQIDPKYKIALTHYGEVVTKKNRVLKRIKEGFAKVDELDFWSEQQLELGQLISQKRQQLFYFLNKAPRQFGSYQFKYAPSLVTPERLRDYRGRELAAATSLIGPHRDDFSFIFNDQDLGLYGSRGEHRMGVLDLKLSEVAFIETQLLTRPIMLLDDIFSELDHDHRLHISRLLGLQQTILVAVELDDDLRTLLKTTDCQIFKVNQANLIPA